MSGQLNQNRTTASGSNTRFLGSNRLLTGVLRLAPHQNNPQILVPPVTAVAADPVEVTIAAQPCFGEWWWWEDPQLEDYTPLPDEGIWAQLPPQAGTTEAMAAQPAVLQAEDLEPDLIDNTLDDLSWLQGFAAAGDPVEVTIAAQPLFSEHDAIVWGSDEDEANADAEDTLLDVGPSAVLHPPAPLEIYAAQPHFGEWLWDREETEDWTPLPDDGVLATFVPPATDDAVGAAQPHYGEWIWDAESAELELANDTALDAAHAVDFPEAPLEVHAAQTAFTDPETPEDPSSEGLVDDLSWFSGLVVGGEPVETFAAQPHYGDRVDEIDEWFEQVTDDVASWALNFPEAPVEVYAAQLFYTDPDTTEPDPHDNTGDGLEWLAGIVTPEPIETFAAQPAFADLDTSEPDPLDNTPDDLSWLAGIVTAEPVETFAAQPLFDQTWVEEAEYLEASADDLAWLAGVGVDPVFVAALAPMGDPMIEEPDAGLYLQGLDDAYVVLAIPPAVVTDVYTLVLQGRWGPTVVEGGRHASVEALVAAYAPRVAGVGAHTPRVDNQGRHVPRLVEAAKHEPTLKGLGRWVPIP